MESSILRGTQHRKVSTIGPHTYVEYKNVSSTDVRVLITRRGEEERGKKNAETGQEILSYNYKEGRTKGLSTDNNSELYI